MDTSAPIWAYLFLGGLIVILMLSLHAKMRQRASRQALRDISNIYEAMLRVLDNTGADRFLILGLHDGGNEIKVHSKRYITIFEEVSTQDTANIKGDYDRYRADLPYIAMFRKLLEDGFVTGNTSEMNLGMLRDAYQAEGIKHYHLFYIGWKNKIHFFGSVSSKNSPMIDPQSLSEIKIAREKIIRLMTRPFWVFN